jgi:hypothetical protein
MNRTATLLVALIVVVASAAVAPAAAAQTDTATSTAPSTAQADTVGYNYVKIFATSGWRNTSRDYSRQYENETATESGNDSVAAGALLSGVIGVQEAEIDGEVESRTFGIKIARANTDDAKAKAVAAQLNASEGRLTELRERLESLEEARENGSISDDRYAARAAKLQTEVNNVQRMGNETATASEGIPRETLEANGVNVTAIETLRQNAANMTGPEVAAVAKTIAGPGAGQGQPPDRAGSAGDRPDGNAMAPNDRADGTGTGPDDRTDGNETDTTTEDGGDGYSSGGGDGADNAAQNGEQGR